MANFKKRRGGVPLSFNSIRAASTVNVVPGTGFPALVGLLFPVPACIFDEAAEGSPSLAAAHEVEPGAATGLPHSCAALAGHSRQISHNALGISPVPAGVRLGSTQARDSRGERAVCCRSAALCGLLTVLALAALHTGIVAGRHGTVGRQTVTPRATAARDGAEFLMENNPVTPQRMWGGPMEVSPMAIQTAYGPTPWTKEVLACHHGCAGSKAMAVQERLDELVVEVLAPPLVEKGVRADQAAESIPAYAERRSLA